LSSLSESRAWEFAEGFLKLADRVYREMEAERATYDVQTADNVRSVASLPAVVDAAIENAKSSTPLIEYEPGTIEKIMREVEG